MRAQQLRLERHQVPVAGRRVDDALEVEVVLDPERDGHRAHPHPGHRGVADVDEVGARVAQQPRGVDRALDPDAPRRVDLDRDDEPARGERVGEARARPAARRRRSSRRTRSAAPEPTSTSAARLAEPRARRAASRPCRSRRARPASPRCAPGVVPQQPPMIRAPASRSRGTIEPKYAGSAAYTNRPSSRWGRPALGMIERAGSPSSGAPNRASASMRRDRPDAAVDADRVDARGGQRRDRLLGRRAVREHQVLAEGHRRDDRDVAGGPRLVDGEQQVAQVEEGLDDEQVDAALEQAVDLLPERGPDRRVRRGGAARASAARAGRSTPPTHASRPDTSRASRATCAARRLNRPASAARPYGSSRNRLAPNVSVSIRSAPASRYSRWIVPTRSGRLAGEVVQAGALRDAAREQQRAHAAVGEERGRGEAGREAVAGEAHAGKPSVPRRAADPASACRPPRAGPAAVAAGRCSVERHRRGVGAGLRDRDEVAAPERRAVVDVRRCRCSRRSGRRPGPARPVRRPRRAVGPTGPPERRERDDRVVRAVQRRADELGHAGVEHDDPLRVGPLADVEHRGDDPPGARDEEPAGLHGEAGGHAVGRQGRRAAPSTSRANRAGGGTVPGSPTGNPPPTSNVSKPGRPAPRSASSASPRRTASRQASTAPSCDPTWRWTPRARSGPSVGQARRPRRSARSRSSRTSRCRGRPRAPRASRGARPG